MVEPNSGSTINVTYNAAGLRAGYAVTPYGAGSPTLSEQFTYRVGQSAQTVVVSGTTSYTDIYVYSQHGMPLELLRTSGGVLNRYWYERDGLGNVVALTDVNGTVVDQYAYDVWGNPTVVQETVPQQLRYQGYWYDTELGWYWLTTRSYDPALKRFLQPDPSETDGLFSYVYVGDDPVDGSDPSGFGVLGHGNCGPDGIYCGAVEEEVAPTGANDPCYYNVDACASEGHMTTTQVAAGGAIIPAVATTSGLGSVAGITGIGTPGIGAYAENGGGGDLPIGGAGGGLGGGGETDPIVSEPGNSATEEAVGGETYLDPSAWGDLYNVKVEVSVQGLDQIEGHLSGTHLNEPANTYAPNVMMVDGLQEALAASEPVSGSYAVFYTHEIFESELMDMGMDYALAHEIALQSYGVSEYTVYDRSVILKYPAEFSNPYRAFWKIGQ